MTGPLVDLMSLSELIEILLSFVLKDVGMWNGAQFYCWVGIFPPLLFLSRADQFGGMLVRCETLTCVPVFLCCDKLLSR